MTKLNARYALEANGDASYRIIDLYRQIQIGDFWSVCGAWTFQLNDGRARFGGYNKVLKSLKLMLRAA